MFSYQLFTVLYVHKHANKACADTHAGLLKSVAKFAQILYWSSWLHCIGKLMFSIWLYTIAD